eukprot:COSAG06_NODE_56_length_27627_cov_106.527136_9_plen_268_part_00
MEGGAGGGVAGSHQQHRMVSGLIGAPRVGPPNALFAPLVPRPAAEFLETIRPVEAEGIIPMVMNTAELILETAVDEKEYGTLRGDPLSADQIAHVMLYSAESTDPPFYKDMNNKCYDPDRSKIKPYGPYMVNLLKTIKLLEAYLGANVYRGVKADLSKDYAKGREVTWHGFASTTKSMEVLEHDQFCGKEGARTIFSIALTQGQARDITRYSMIEAEDEVLLPPGCKFKVESLMDAGNGLTIIQIKELPSKAWIIDISPRLRAVAAR